MLFTQSSTQRENGKKPDNNICGPGTYFVKDESSKKWSKPVYRFGSGRESEKYLYLSKDYYKQNFLGVDSPGPLAAYDPKLPPHDQAATFGPHSRGFKHLLPSGEIKKIKGEVDALFHSASAPSLRYTTERPTTAQSHASSKWVIIDPEKEPFFSPKAGTFGTDRRFKKQRQKIEFISRGHERVKWGSESPGPGRYDTIHIPPLPSKLKAPMDRSKMAIPDVLVSARVIAVPSKYDRDRNNSLNLHKVNVKRKDTNTATKCPGTSVPLTSKVASISLSTAPKVIKPDSSKGAGEAEKKLPAVEGGGVTHDSNQAKGEEAISDEERERREIEALFGAEEEVVDPPGTASKTGSEESGEKGISLVLLVESKTSPPHDQSPEEVIPSPHGYGNEFEEDGSPHHTHSSANTNTSPSSPVKEDPHYGSEFEEDGSPAAREVHN